MSKLKFGFIGCGRMARFHAQVIRCLDHDIYATLSRRGSQNIEPFVNDFKVARGFTDQDNFFKEIHSGNLRLDALVLCTPWDVTEEVVNYALDTGLPVLAEKPVALSERKALDIMGHVNRDNLLVGFNRRFYDYMPHLSEMIRSKPPYFVDILSAEPYSLLVKEYGTGVSPFLPHFYTSHLIDLAGYLLGPLDIVRIQRLAELSQRSLTANLIARTSGCLVNLSVIMDCAQNSYVRCYFDDYVVVLNPIETMYICDGIERVVTNGKTQYITHFQKTIHTSDDFKPGIYLQMKYFINEFIVKRSVRSPNTEDIIRVTRLCDQLTKGEI